MTSRPTVSVYDSASDKIDGSSTMPTVFSAPIRDDLVSFCHANMAKNRRQGHAVYWHAGHKHSAESWGTGRAVARIPRVSGSGTHRSGQAAFGNMCRKGRMAHPLQTWRRWHRKVNLRQRRHALASAVAATACAPLVMARGHRVMSVAQLPLILDDTVGQISKTKEAIALLRAFGAYEDVQRVVNTRKLRAGIGKLRNKRNKMRRGPLVVVDEGCENLRRALRNVPGVDLCNVNRLNIRSLAPGGHLGRFCIWTQSAFSALEKHFGSGNGVSSTKKGYRLQKEVTSSADLSSLINSDVIQSALKPFDHTRNANRRTKTTKANLLTNRRAMAKVNPYSTVLRTMRQKEAGVKRKITKDERKKKNVFNKASKSRINKTLARVEETIDEYVATYQEQTKSMQI